MKSKVRCYKCGGWIYLEKDKYVFLGTYNKSKATEELYFHFNCWTDWFKEKVLEKLNLLKKTAIQKAVGMVKEMVGGEIRI